MDSILQGDSSKVRVVLIDDHHLFREGLRSVIGIQGDMIVVGEASEGAKALEVVEHAQPDLVICDVSLPVMSGIDVARDILARHPHMRILVLTMHRPEDYADDAFRAGAIGYASKAESPDAILGAIRKAARGERYMATRQADSMPPQAAMSAQREANGAVATLSRRETEIFALVVQGLSNDSLSKRLCISIKTVETHRASINRKLGVHSTAQLVRFAARHGLLSMA